jgi:hypothetical protein
MNITKSGRRADGERTESGRRADEERTERISRWGGIADGGGIVSLFNKI